MPNAYTRTTTIRLNEEERAELSSMARSRSLPAALALRARIVLACEGDDKASTDVARMLGLHRSTVAKWRSRYQRHRIGGLYDELRPGRPRTVDDERVAELINKITKFVDNYNETCQPFTWTATADSILEKLARLCGRINGTGH
ncbi:helix-turn-helix domain-containing protein [Ralstonia solanacearum]|uniref:helix-turn-helix domain-containing protein n=1 Tax=Ralstonia solanacearum TaxID=305 RepID=UPI001FF976F6|nr:helix-turn-helix domain-containing protein [Ralstonia solanacearum]MDB0528268.1 helix-turn-helix domain-containing protein [Ralstonia solanacearum]